MAIIYNILTKRNVFSYTQCDRCCKFSVYSKTATAAPPYQKYLKPQIFNKAWLSST